MNRSSVVIIGFLVSMVLANEVRRSYLANRELADMNLLPTVARLTLGMRTEFRAKGLLYLTCNEANELRIVAHTQLPAEIDDTRVGSLDNDVSLLFDDNVHGNKNNIEFLIPPLRLQRREFLDLIVSEPLDNAKSTDLTYLLQNYKPTKISMYGFHETGLSFRLLATSAEIKSFINQCQRPTAS